MTANENISAGHQRPMWWMVLWFPSTMLATRAALQSPKLGRPRRAREKQAHGGEGPQVVPVHLRLEEHAQEERHRDHGEDSREIVSAPAHRDGEERGQESGHQPRRAAPVQAAPNDGSEVGQGCERH